MEKEFRHLHQLKKALELQLRSVQKQLQVSFTNPALLLLYNVFLFWVFSFLDIVIDFPVGVAIDVIVIKVV